MEKKKEYTPLEVAEELRKSLYKMVKKAYKQTNGNKNNYKEDAQKVVRDVLDPNFIAEVNPENVPETKDHVLWKGKDKDIKKAKVDDKISGMGDKIKARNMRNSRYTLRADNNFGRKAVGTPRNEMPKSPKSKEDRREDLEYNKKASKPSLPKSEEKGVDKLKKFKKSKGVQPTTEVSGQSEAGNAARKMTDAKNRKVPKEDWWANAKQLTQYNQGKKEARSKHTKAIIDNRNMGKPDLPKSEK